MNLNPVLFLTLLSLFLPSCGNHFYTASSHNTPVFNDAGQFKVNLGASHTPASTYTDKETGAEAQIAYSLSRRYAFTSSFSYREMAGADILSRGYYGEGAFGYFTAIDEDLSFSAFTGLGAGRGSYTYFRDSPQNTSYAKLYIQPAMAFTRKYVQVALSLRIAGLHHYHLETPPKVLDSKHFQKISTLASHPTNLLLETAGTFRLGKDPLKIQFQTGYVSHAFMPDPLSGYFGSIGIHFTVPQGG